MTQGPGRSLRDRVTRFAAHAAIVVLVVVAVSAYQARNLLPADRQLAPALRGQTLAGDLLDLQDRGDRPVVVYFFAPWCKVCGASADNLRRLRRFFDEDDLDRLPFERVAQMRVIHVEDDFSTALVTRSRRELKRGWRVEMYEGY